jgi:beta-lactamase superfamily II metal-dependent hydrolase
MTNRKGLLAAVAVFLILAICAIVIATFVTPAGYGTLEPLTVTILKVGKADAIILQCQSSTMVIDAGERTTAWR